MSDEIRADWLAEFYIDDHGVEGAVAELQQVVENNYDEQADRALEVLSIVRQRKEVEA